jgi:hypothetical protein
MATYSDSMTGYADFESTGRYFAAVMAGSAVAGAAALYVGSGHLSGVGVDTPSLSLVSMAGYVALTLSVVMAITVAGSLLITKRGKEIISISPEGVLRKTPKKEVFLAREEILGMAVVPGGRLPRGTMLVTADRRRNLFIPRRLGGYGACLGELQKMGIATLPPYRRSGAEVAAQWLNRAGAFVGMVFLLEGIHTPMLQGRKVAFVCLGLGIVAISALWLQWFEQRRG